MKRIIMILTVALVMAAMMVAMAMPAFAVANETASCRGQGISDTATSEPGAVGEGTSSAAQSDHPYGKNFVSELAHEEPPCFFSPPEA